MSPAVVNFPTNAEFHEVRICRCSSVPDAVTEMHHTVAEAAFIQQFKSQADIVRERRQATSDDDGGEEQVALVDQPHLQRLGGHRRLLTEMSRVAAVFMS
jgi:hypothetical protein